MLYVKSSKPVLPVQALSWINQWTDVFGDDYYDNVTDEVVRVLRCNLADGLSVEQTMGKLSVYLNRPGFNDRRLEIIARTNATSTFNEGRMETFRQAGDFVQQLEFSAILDSRVTDICEARDGKLFKFGDPAVEANTPPLYYNCRSVLSQ